MLRKWLSFMVLTALFIFPTVTHAEVNQASLQLITGQKTVGQDGEIDYFILYEKPSILTKNKITVKIPDGLTVASAGNSQFNEIENTLTWQVGDASGVLTFTLKTDATVKTGDRLEVNATANFSSTVTADPVTVEVGSEVHQPFFQGYPDGTFRPKSKLTRAETAAIISRIKNLTDDHQLNNPYKDVSSSHWAQAYITKVTNAGYMEGYNGKFRPDDPITRAELITLTLRMRGIEPIGLPTDFNDINGHWAENMMTTANALHFLDGTTNGDIMPNSYIARDESAKLLSIAFFRGELTDGDIAVNYHFPDVKKDDPRSGWIEESSSVAHETVRSGLKEALIKYLPEQTEPF